MIYEVTEKGAELAVGEILELEDIPASLINKVRVCAVQEPQESKEFDVSAPRRGRPRKEEE